jgi:hypothetical protein
MSTNWTWPEGKTLGELTPDEKRAAIDHAAARLQQELTAAAPEISRIMDEAIAGETRTCRWCELETSERGALHRYGLALPVEYACTDRRACERRARQL